MAKKKGGSGKQGKNSQKFLLTIILSVILVAAVFYFSGTDPAAWFDQIDNALPALLDQAESPSKTAKPDQDESPETGEATTQSSKTPKPSQEPGDFSRVMPQDGKLSVLVLDIGQGDSIFIKTPDGKTMLVDTGEYEHWQTLKGYLTKLGVTKIDALVGTHPHSDHIGSMQSVVKNYDIGAIYMPRVEHTTNTYLNLLEAIKKKGLKIKGTKGGDTSIIPLGDSVTVRVFAPLGDEYESMNNYSIVLQLSYGDNSILLAGDAESLSEGEMVEKFGSALNSNVLKVGHHGSRTSTSARFLKAVSPSSAIISCGSGNDYGHPHEETMSRLKKAKIDIYETDTMGTVAFFTDGKKFSIETER